MKKYLLIGIAMVVMAAGCQPSDQQPGLWLSGNPQPFPDDWSFTQDTLEVGLQVVTPYFLPHSVTIWCVSLDGDLFIAAAEPETKKWPSWVNDDPNIVIKVGDQLFDAHAEPLRDAATLARLKNVYKEKYKRDLSDVDAWYWSVTPRA